MGHVSAANSVGPWVRSLLSCSTGLCPGVCEVVGLKPHHSCSSLVSCYWSYHVGSQHFICVAQDLILKSESAHFEAFRLLNLRPSDNLWLILFAGPNPYLQSGREEFLNIHVKTHVCVKKKVHFKTLSPEGQSPAGKKLTLIPSLKHLRPECECLCLMEISFSERIAALVCRH